MPRTPPDPATALQDALDDAEIKAWKSLAGYNFVMFGYWCAIHVHLNRISGANRPNPFRELVHLARGRVAQFNRTEAQNAPPHAETPDQLPLLRPPQPAPPPPPY